MIKDINDYLPILNAIIITDLIFMLLMNLKIINSKFLKSWYLRFNLSAVIADVLIIFIVIIFSSYIYNILYTKFSFIRFILLLLIIQIIHDIIFYIIINNISKGQNRIVDIFKDYINEISYKAIIADSIMVIMSCIIGYYLIKMNKISNINILIVLIYLIPYFINNN